MSKYGFKFGQKKQAIALNAKASKTLPSKELEDAQRIEDYLKGIPKERHIPTRQL